MTEPTEQPPVDAASAAAQVTESLAAAFRAFTTQQQQARTDELALTMSGLGECTRQAAYRAAGTPPSDDTVYGQKRAANLGTMQHAGLLPQLAATFGDAEHERAVTLQAGTLVIEGTTDLYWRGGRMVLDLKTVGQHKLTKVRGRARAAHRLQVGGYALAAHQEGLPVRWVAWLYLDRASGEDRVVVEPFTAALAQSVLERCAEIEDYSRDPDSAPREERGPGLSFTCDECPWLRRCWGADATAGQAGAQTVLARDEPGVIAALASYDAARSRESSARSEKEFARAVLGEAEPGRYGTWELGWSAPSEENDPGAAYALLEQAGIPVPKRVGVSRLNVRPARTSRKGAR